jgi:hypothetical protein
MKTISKKSAIKSNGHAPPDPMKHSSEASYVAACATAKKTPGPKQPKLSPLEAEAAKLLKAFSAKDQAEILKKFPEASEIAPKPGLATGKDVGKLLIELAEIERREKVALGRYADLRRDGAKALDPWRITQVKSAAVAFGKALMQEMTALIERRTEIGSIKARLVELQGSLVEPPKALPAPPTVIKAENPKDVVWITLRLAVLEACLSVAAKKDERHYLEGVHLQAVKRELRVAATNGHTLLLHSTPDLPDLPDWLNAGVILPRDELALALGCIAKTKNGEDEPQTAVQLGYAAGHGHVIVRDPDHFATFRLPVIAANFPDYQKVIEGAGSVLAGGEHAPLTATTMQGQYMKQAAAIGARFDAKGITPFFSGDEKTPTVVTFGGEPGALFIIMPMASSSELQMPVQTMALIGRGLEGTLAALKASQTRQKKQLADSKSEGEKKSLTAAIATRDERIASVVLAIKGKLLEAPKAA